uniref:Uncharacterized protein n=1 Tax=Arundo donax TaxID=35708 RepID=A0A0A9AC50_ARUDO
MHNQLKLIVTDCASSCKFMCISSQ